MALLTLVLSYAAPTLQKAVDMALTTPAATDVADVAEVDATGLVELWAVSLRYRQGLDVRKRVHHFAYTWAGADVFPDFLRTVASAGDGAITRAVYWSIPFYHIAVLLVARRQAIEAAIVFDGLTGTATTFFAPPHVVREPVANGFAFAKTAMQTALRHLDRSSEMDAHVRSRVVWLDVKPRNWAHGEFVGHQTIREAYAASICRRMSCVNGRGDQRPHECDGVSAVLEWPPHSGALLPASCRA